MAWSETRPPLPPDWQKRRIFVFNRDKNCCMLAYKDICLGVATEVDHIDRNDDHRMSNLRAVCHDCHSERTRQQAADALRAAWATTKVPRPKHPGLL